MQGERAKNIRCGTLRELSTEKQILSKRDQTKWNRRERRRRAVEARRKGAQLPARGCGQGRGEVDGGWERMQEKVEKKREIWSSAEGVLWKKNVWVVREAKTRCLGTECSWGCWGLGGSVRVSKTSV